MTMPTPDCRWFDTHCHLDRLTDDALPAAQAAGVARLVVPGVTGVPAAPAAEGVVYTAGVHPLHLDAVADLSATLDAMAAALRDDPRCVAIGEIGLDFWDRPDAAARAHQEDALRVQLALAASLGCPVIVHLRKAWKEFLALAVEHADLTWVMHMFSGGPDYATALCKRLPNVYFGFGGPAARANARKPLAVLHAVGRERALLETDAPDLTPPGLKKPNRPAYLPGIGARIAAKLSIPAEEFAAVTFANSERVFGESPAP